MFKESNINLDISLTLGEIIKTSYFINHPPETIDFIIGFPKGTTYLLFADEIYPNSMPIKLMARFLVFSKIEINQAVIGINNTFKHLQKNQAKDRYIKEPIKQLWENEESLNKYITRLRELVTK